MFRSTVGIGLCVALCVAASAAHADDAGAQAQVLFDEGKRLMDAADYPAACPKLAESQRLDPGNGTLARLATCHEKQGKTATAWSEFAELVTSAQRAGQADRERFARQRIAALEPRLSRLTVIVPADVATTAGLVVQRDAIAVGVAAWGVGIPVDPGDHVIEASAPGKQAWSSHVTIGAANDAQQVTLPALVSVEVQAPPIAAGQPVAVPPSTGAANPESGARSSQKTWGLVVGAVGIVGLGVGSYFGIQALSGSSQAKQACPDPACPTASAIQQNDDARSDARIADVGFAVGAGALVAGSLLYFLAPAGSGLRVAPVVGRANGIVAQKSW
ncbi:MAG TPA: hypothetical protein VK762_12875 [Polyangiaceae bacterium]|jgi:hypothetical protein|nr:hypothetical protein [Polyangiaceae bacterium]